MKYQLLTAATDVSLYLAGITAFQTSLLPIVVFPSSFLRLYRPSKVLVTVEDYHVGITTYIHMNRTAKSLERARTVLHHQAEESKACSNMPNITSLPTETS